MRVQWGRGKQVRHCPLSPAQPEKENQEFSDYIAFVRPIMCQNMTLQRRCKGHTHLTTEHGKTDADWEAETCEYL